MATLLVTIPSSSIPYQSDTSVISAYNRGPITSVFVPAASCTETLTLDPDGHSILYVGHDYNSDVNFDCYPTGTRNSMDLIPMTAWNSYYYSPAICPQSWTTATVFTSTWFGFETNKADPLIISLVPLDPATTAVLCCPSEYLWFGQGHQCSSTITKGQVVGYRFPVSIGPSKWSSGPVSYSTLATDTIVRVDGVPVWWQSTDEAALASASSRTPILSSRTAPTGDVTLASSSSVTTAMNTAAGTPTSNPDAKPSFPNGAKIGLGVGLPALIAMLAFVWFILRRRKSVRSHSSTDGRQGQDMYGHGKPGQLHEAQGIGPRYELPDVQVHELQSVNGLYSTRHELPGTN